jgi:hypothetical protein
MRKVQRFVGRGDCFNEICSYAKQRKLHGLVYCLNEIWHWMWLPVQTISYVCRVVRIQAQSVPLIHEGNTDDENNCYVVFNGLSSILKYLLHNILRSNKLYIAQSSKNERSLRLLIKLPDSFMLAESNGANEFCFLSSLPLPPSHHGSIWLLPVISLLLTLIRAAILKRHRLDGIKVN